MNRRHLALQVLAQQPHQEVHFGFRAAPVLEREGVEREARYFQPGARIYHLARGLHPGAVPCYARQVAALRPAAIAVHDDGEMLRQPLQIELFEKRNFLPIAGFQEIGWFHGRWHEECPQGKLAQRINACKAGKYRARNNGSTRCTRKAWGAFRYLPDPLNRPCSIIISSLRDFRS